MTQAMYDVANDQLREEYWSKTPVEEMVFDATAGHVQAGRCDSF
jgi:hypothetical protein